jgi:hypothetical protein
MKATNRYTFTVALLTALGVLPVPAEAAPNRSPQSRLGSLEFERTTIVAAVKRIPGDIRAGRLGH